MRRWVVVVVCAVLALVLTRELHLSLPIVGIGPDLVIFVVVAFGAYSRRVEAAATGFAVGLMRDLLTGLPPGTAAAVYALAGWGAALIGPPSSVWVSMLALGLATLSVHLLIGALALLFGPTPSVLFVIQVAFVTAAYNAVLAPILFPGVRRAAVMASPITES